MEWFSKYRKFWVALLGAVLQTVVTYFGENNYVQIAIAVLTALGVYQTPNQVGAVNRKR